MACEPVTLATEIDGLRFLGLSLSLLVVSEHTVVDSAVEFETDLDATARDLYAITISSTFDEPGGGC